jgi:hypothetical protein
MGSHTDAVSQSKNIREAQDTAEVIVNMPFGK